MSEIKATQITWHEGTVTREERAAAAQAEGVHALVHRAVRVGQEHPGGGPGTGAHPARARGLRPRRRQRPVRAERGPEDPDGDARLRGGVRPSGSGSASRPPTARRTSAGSARSPSCSPTPGSRADELHQPVPQGPRRRPDDPREEQGRGDPVHRGVREHADRVLRAARPEGPVQAGPGGGRGRARGWASPASTTRTRPPLKPELTIDTGTTTDQGGGGDAVKLPAGAWDSGLTEGAVGAVVAVVRARREPGGRSIRPSGTLSPPSVRTGLLCIWPDPHRRMKINSKQSFSLKFARTSR